MALRKKVTINGVDYWQVSPKLHEIEENIYLMKKGVRGAYMMTLTGYNVRYTFGCGGPEDLLETLEDQLKEVKEIVREHGLFFHSHLLAHDEYDLDDEDTAVVWIYRFPHQGRIIRSLKGDHSYTEEWIIGKLLGYDDYAMEEFLKKNF